LRLSAYIPVATNLYEEMVDVNRKVPCTPLCHTAVSASFQTGIVATSLLYTPRTAPGNVFSTDSICCSDGHMAPMIGILRYWESSCSLTRDEGLLFICISLLYLREISFRFTYRKVVKREIAVLTDLIKPEIRSAVCLLLPTFETTKLFQLKDT